MLLYLTVYFSSKFDCLYVVSFSGLLGFCFVCFYWLESKGIFLHTISPYLMTQAKYKHGKAAVPVSEYTGTSLFICVSSLALWRIVENGNHQHQF